MAFLWGSGNSSQFDQLVEQCTSDLLPAKSPLDLDAALRIADAVRSATVPPTEAAIKLVTRLGHENPNVQLLALQLADVLVKNAGNQFLKAFASIGPGGAVNHLERLCSSSGSGTTRPPVNRDVQLAARQKLQEWASAFEASGRPLLSQSDLVNLYHRLRTTTSVPFPAQADAHTTAAMVDSLSAPDWSDSPYCTRCRTEFSTFNRKHHCRNCGHVFDQQCSSQSMPLPHYGITTELVRVCDACAKQIKQGKGAQVARTILQQQQQAATTTRRRRGEDEVEQEDADLQRAIQASLAESTSAASHGPVRHSPPPHPPSSSLSGYHPSYASQIQSFSDSKGGNGKEEEEEEEDPDLAAAIAASLKDLEAPSSRPRASAPASASAPAQTYSDLFPASSSDNRATAASKTAPKTAFHLPSYDLTAAEQSHLSQFLLSSSSSSSSSQLDPAYPPTSHESYHLVSQVLQPKLDRSLRDARTRGQILREMEAKLSEAARLYGAGLLTERVVGQQPQPQPQPQAYRSSSSSYSIPTASASASNPYSTTPYQDPTTAAMTTTRYHYAPPPTAAAAAAGGYGQPLPAYAVPAVVVPPPPQTVDAASASVAPQQQEYNAAVPAAAVAPPPQQQQHYQQQQQPAGFYKPSQFPPVPQTDPHSQSQSVLGLPNVPRENPWNTTNNASLDRRREEEEEEEEAGEREEQKVGELIEL